MDYKQFYEFVDKMMFSKDIIDMNSEILFLRKYLYGLMIMKDRFNRGDIAKGVNNCIALLNRKYGTNFKCEKDEDFVMVLTNMINYIDAKGTEKIKNKIEEEIAKKLK